MDEQTRADEAQILKRIEEAPSLKLQLYALLFVVIDGSLQVEEQRVDVRRSGEKTRVYVRWAVPLAGLEFDPRRPHPVPEAERTFQVGVMSGGGEWVLRSTAMRCVHFAVGHEVDRPARARAIFECER